MQPNRVRERLAAGQRPIGHLLLEFGSRGMAALLESAGLDFVVIDTEHTAFSIREVGDLLAWFRGTTVTPFVRVPQPDYHFIARALDAGALGVMVPNVTGAAQAQAIVAATKYAPLGQRGVIVGVANTHYRPVAPGEFMAHSNANTTVICQIESQEGLENLDAIAATPGVDVLWVGQFDLSQSLGIPGDFQAPRFLDALRAVVSAARRHGLAAAIMPTTQAQAAAWSALGFNMIAYSADLFVYREALASAVATLRAGLG